MNQQAPPGWSGALRGGAASLAPSSRTYVGATPVGWEVGSGPLRQAASDSRRTKAIPKVAWRSITGVAIRFASANGNPQTRSELSRCKGRVESTNGERFGIRSWWLAAGQAFRSLGSKTSRNPSPSMLYASTTMTMVTPGNIDNHQAALIDPPLPASLNIPPHVASLTDAPSPRKLRLASDMMAAPK